MALFEFTCRQCEGSFAIEAHDIVRGDEELECTHCDFEFHKAGASDFAAALGEFLEQLKALNKKFAFSAEFNSDTLNDSEEALDDDDEEADEKIDEDEDEDEAS